MTRLSYRQLAGDGLWRQNPALAQLLGLCPLLAVSTSFATALGLGLVSLAVLTLANFSVSLLRRLLDDATRLPAQILVIATFVTLADLLLQYGFFELHQRIGLFVALIVTNCTLLGRAEAFASRQPVLAAIVDGFMMGLGFLLALLAMGSVRELLGQGTLFAGLHLLTGLPDLTLRVADRGFILMLMPPGAFLTFGCLLALKNWVEARWEGPEAAERDCHIVAPPPANAAPVAGA